MDKYWIIILLPAKFFKTSNITKYAPIQAILWGKLTEQEHNSPNCKKVNYMVPANKKLLAGTVSADKKLLAETVSANKELLAETVPSNKELLAETVSANNLFQ